MANSIVSLISIYLFLLFICKESYRYCYDEYSQLIDKKYVSIYKEINLFLDSYLMIFIFNLQSILSIMYR